MNRRIFLQGALGSAIALPAMAAIETNQFETAAEVLNKAVADGKVRSASICVRQLDRLYEKSFGEAKTPEALFLLASISKPISAAALMALFDEGKFKLDDSASKFIPEFTGDGREQITILQLLTHTSGLPDQLPENESLRKQHAPLSKFVAQSFRTPLLFKPGLRYRYSSMGILLAGEIAQRISGVNFKELVEERVFRPLKLQRSALGLGAFKLADTMRVQTETAEPEAGGGREDAKGWDWNSEYWRKLGSPWGGAHSSASDVATFFAELLNAEGRVLKPETGRLMIQNHNPANLSPRGLGFALGPKASATRCSEQTFSHSGATGTLAWADPKTNTICVVLTTLPERAASPHPMRLVGNLVAESAA
jgi:CubicO group peptidase (beta-lactamase class C family)